MRKFLVVVFSIGFVVSSMGIIYILSDFDLRAKVLAKLFNYPTVTFSSVLPENEGMDAHALDALGKEMLAQNTNALLIVRGGNLVYERYSKNHGVNKSHYTAAMAKALSGITTLLVCASEGYLSLNEPLSKYYPKIKSEPLRSKIRIRDLAFHSSGIEDVDFYKGKKGELKGWKKEYYEQKSHRFKFALESAPMLFEPGTRGKYSGVGYYALAYAVTKSLQGSPYHSIYDVFKKRIAKPLGLPTKSWSLSYGESYQVDGMNLYAFGSGAGFTARATAKIGELMLRKGQWEGETVFNEDSYNQVLDRGILKTHGRIISNNHGWITNINKEKLSLPPDAYFGLGGGHQVVLVVPSLDLVMVRNGAAIKLPGKDFHQILEQQLFKPLMSAVVGKSSRQKNIITRLN